MDQLGGVCQESSHNMELITSPLYLDANLVSYWRFENNVTDSKGSNNGTNSPSYIVGKFGSGLGTTMTLANNLFKYTTESFSISGWKRTTAGGDIGVFSNSIINAGDYSGYDIDSSGGYVRFSVYPTNGTPTVNTITSSVTVNDNNWHHIVCTKSGTTGKIYIDGIEKATGTVGNPSYDTTHTPQMGASSAHYTDDLAIFSRALTATEVSQLYNNKGGSLFFAQY